MLSYILIQLERLYSFAIVVYCIFTWFPIPRDGVVRDIYAFFAKICEPYLALFRRLLPPIGGAVDVTPIIAIVVLELAVRLIVFLL